MKSEDPDAYSNGSPCPQTSKEISKYDLLPSYILHNINHFRQRYSWDCGVACVLMVLPIEKKLHFLENFNTICYEEDFGESTWTIDLCYLLNRYDIDHRMYSTQMGVNEEHKKIKYYQNMEKDRNRVQQRFKEASSQGLRVRKGVLTDHSLKKHLAEFGPVIVLVDNTLLACDLCKHNKIKYEFRRMFGGSYCGHYVVLVGYSGGRYLYRDPALPPRVCAAAPLALLRARAAPGTDHDLILIYYKRNKDIKVDVQLLTYDLFRGLANPEVLMPPRHS